MKIKAISAVLMCLCFAAYGGDTADCVKPLNNTTTTTSTQTTTQTKPRPRSTPAVQPVTTAAVSYPTAVRDAIALKQGDSLPTRTIFPNIAGKPSTSAGESAVWLKIETYGPKAKPQ